MILTHSFPMEVSFCFVTKCTVDAKVCPCPDTYSVVTCAYILGDLVIKNWITTIIMFNIFNFRINYLTHWGRVTHICVGKLTTIGSDIGLSPGRRQAIIWTNAGILLIRPLGANFIEILIETHTFSFKKIHLKMSSGKRRPFCLGLNELMKYA